MVEMVLFLAGIYTIVFGKLGLPGNLSLQGWRARIAAVFLLIPLPAAILLSRVVGRGLPAEKAQSIFGITELALVSLGLGGALVIAFLWREKDSQ